MFGGSQMRIIHWRKGFFCVAMLVRATTGLARAEDHAAGFQILTPGSRPSCDSYTTERTFPTRGQQLQYWALGFLSGVNISGSAGTDFLEPIDGQAVWAWLDNYCRDHPLDEFPGAIKALVRELVARRAQHK